MPSFRSPVASRALSAQDLASFTLQQFDTEFTAGPWKLTLSQLVRGTDAASQIAAASDQNAAPPDGFDYLLFQVNATNAGQERTWLDYDDFAVMGSSGLVHRSLELMPPDPMLQAAVEPGASTSGWVVGEIEVGRSIAGGVVRSTHSHWTLGRPGGRNCQRVELSQHGSTGARRSTTLVRLRPRQR